jgi:hypothetical protein
MLDGDEQRQLEMLKTRLELHNEVYNSRLKREQKAKQRAGLIKRYIGTRDLACCDNGFATHAQPGLNTIVCSVTTAGQCVGV